MTETEDPRVGAYREQSKSPITNTFFAEQGKNEKAGGHPLRPVGSAPDFVRVAHSTLSTIYQIASEDPELSKHSIIASKVELTPEEYRERIFEFMGALREIEMADTHFAEVRTAIPSLVAESDVVTLWTSGHPNYQHAKIERSGIQQMLKDAEAAQPAERLPVVTEPIISQDKEARVVTYLEDIAAKYPDREIMLVVYDDSEGNFKKVEKRVAEFEEKTGKKVTRNYVWACTGRVSENYQVQEGNTGEVIQAKQRKREEKTAQLAQQGIATASSMIDLVKIIKARKSENPKAVVANLIDYDGAVSDNRIMRLMQGNAFDNLLLRIIEDLLRKSRGGEIEEEEVTARANMIRLRLEETMLKSKKEA